MNRRSAIASSILGALGLHAVPAKAEASEWVNILTGQVLVPTDAPEKRVNVTWRNRTIEVLYVFPAGPVPCIVAIKRDQVADWLAMIREGDVEQPVVDTSEEALRGCYKYDDFHYLCFWDGGNFNVELMPAAGP